MIIPELYERVVVDVLPLVQHPVHRERFVVVAVVHGVGVCDRSSIFTAIEAFGEKSAAAVGQFPHPLDDGIYGAHRAQCSLRIAALDAQVDGN